MCLKLLLGNFLAIIAFIAAVFLYYCYKSPIDGTIFVPELEKAIWNLDHSKNNDKSIIPFKIKVEKQVIQDLKERLENVRLTPPLEGIQHQYGMNTNLLKDVIHYWKTEYNWTQRENYLNQYPQFKTRIQGLDIHFIQVKPKKPAGKSVLPLLLMHGWPGSVREFYDIIPLLITPRDNYDFVFELIAPSLPGYGFSDAAAKPGLASTQIGVLFKLLMDRLGYEEFYVQGGDYGAAIIQAMGKLYPNNILGIHSNTCLIHHKLAFFKEIIISLYPSFFVPEDFIDAIYPFTQRFEKLLKESGYFHIQATKPDTVGVSLSDSPAGLAAYILEKFSSGTNFTYQERADGGLREKFTYDSLLDNVMLYWINNAMTSAMRLYSETFSVKHLSMMVHGAVITPPSACAAFKNDVSYQPPWILKDVYKNLVHATTYTTAGHFPAMEAPKILADDIFVGISKVLKFNKEQATKPTV